MMAPLQGEGAPVESVVWPWPVPREYQLETSAPPEPAEEPIPEDGDAPDEITEEPTDDDVGEPTEEDN